MNQYRVECNEWFCRVRGASFATAASRGLSIIAKSAGLTKKETTVAHVKIVVLARNVKRSDPFPYDPILDKPKEPTA